jgi:hypothetical protein
MPARLDYHAHAASKVVSRASVSLCAYKVDLLSRSQRPLSDVHAVLLTANRRLQNRKRSEAQAVQEQAQSRQLRPSIPEVSRLGEENNLQVNLSLLTEICAN